MFYACFILMIIHLFFDKNQISPGETLVTAQSDALKTKGKSIPLLLITFSYISLALILVKLFNAVAPDEFDKIYSPV